MKLFKNTIIYIALWIFKIIIAPFTCIEYFASKFHKGYVTKDDLGEYFKKGKVLAIVKFFIMPTRVRSEIIKTKDISKFPDFMKNMTKYSLLASFLMVPEQNVLHYLMSLENTGLAVFGILLTCITLLWATSRILEISYAFFNDAHTHLEKLDKNSPITGLKYPDRIRLAMYSYVELVILFASLYYALSAISISIFCISGKQAFMDIINAIYFSGVTITTLGYGDISPNIFISKILVIFEVLSGFTLIIVSFTIYVSRAIREMDDTRDLSITDKIKLRKKKLSSYKRRKISK